MNRRDRNQLASSYRKVMWARRNSPLAKKYWDEVCALIRERDNWTCQKCHKRGWVVHHKTYKHIHFEHAFPEDLVTLCPECHAWVHGKLWYQFGKAPRSKWFKLSN